MAGCCIPNTHVGLEDLDEKIYVFSSEKWPEKWSEVPSIGNGHVAAVIKYPWMHMSGLFNGEGVKSQRAKIPSTFLVNLKHSDGGSQQAHVKYKLDTRTGTFIEDHEINGWRISLKWYAHRLILPISVFQITAKRHMPNNKETLENENPPTLNSNKSCEFVDLQVCRNMTSDDIDFEKLSSKFSNVEFYHGSTKISEDPALSKNQNMYLLHDCVPDRLELKRDFTKWTFITSIHYSKVSAIKAYSYSKRLEKRDKLWQIHSKEWLRLWESGRIEVEGNLLYGRAAAASLYNVLSSIPLQSVNPLTEDECTHSRGNKTLFTGLSPSGLSWGDEETYQGHTFWDAETWMFPAVLLLHHDLCQTLLHSRVRTMDVAARNATKTSLKGLRYPWESALTGIETAPDTECGDLEIHINGDISLAILQYLRSSPKRLDEIPSAYFYILQGIGDFWLSRAVFDSDSQLYRIKRVMPPDEYAKYVDDSAFTNAVASISLKCAAKAAKILGHSGAEVYEEAANRMYIPYDKAHDYHPEFDGFQIGTRIKQADVVLMGFPLMMQMSKSTRKNDLEIYEKNTSPRGPAMSDSMHSIGWLEVGEAKKAHESFLKMFQHINGDFQVWTEGKGGEGAPNFITGMGGYLQALLFGYGGLRILDDKLLINPSIMPDASSISWYGIDHRGCSFDLQVDDAREMIVTLKRIGRGLKMFFELSGAKIPLKRDQPVKMNAGQGYLRVERP